jgi:hypothetical protein
MMLPGHGHELEAVYAPYTDRPSASNVHREGYHFKSGVFEREDER